MSGGIKKIMRWLKRLGWPVWFSLTGLVLLAVVVMIIRQQPLTRQKYLRDIERRQDARLILEAILLKREQQSDALIDVIDQKESTVQIIGQLVNVDCDDLNFNCGGYHLARAKGECVVDLTSLLTPEPLTRLPVDPLVGMGNNSQYFINQLNDNRLVIGACQPEISSSIKITR